MLFRSKMLNAQDYYNDTLPFTRMSKGCLDKYKTQYNNVYEKGALIGMCLDILLRYNSNGRYGTQDLMADLSRSYGKETAFRDDELFSKITSLTYPSIGEFLNKCVSGNEKLPFADVFKKVGFNYLEKKQSEEITLGDFDLGYNPVSERLVVEGTFNLNEFGKKMHYKDGDEFVTFNGEKLTLSNAREVFEKIGRAHV